LPTTSQNIFAIIPAAMVTIYPQWIFSISCTLANPYSAILSAVIFNAIIIPMLIPLALKGVKYRQCLLKNY